MPVGSKLTAANVKEARRLYKEGESLSKLAKRYKVASCTIFKYVKDVERDVLPKWGRPPNKNFPAALKALEEGANKHLVIANLKIPQTSLNRFLQKVRKERTAYRNDERHKEIVIQMVASGQSRRSVAEELGICETKVQNWTKHLPKPKTGIKQKYYINKAYDLYFNKGVSLEELEERFGDDKRNIYMMLYNERKRRQHEESKTSSRSVREDQHDARRSA